MKTSGPLFSDDVTPEPTTSPRAALRSFMASGRRTYAERKAARIERMRVRAEKLRAEADAAQASVHKTLEVMNGTPILVGHHSERRHRRDIDRIDAKMSRAFAGQKEAKNLERRADAAERNDAISSDDPEALTLLRDKLAKLDADRARMVAANKAIRGKFPHAALVAMGFSAGFADELLREDFAGRIGFPDYKLRNAAAESKRLQKRIADMVARADAPVRPDCIFDGGRITEDRDENRVRVLFDAKPAEAVRAALKGAGFRWAPSVGAWQRHASEGAWYAARRALGLLGAP